MGKHTKGHIVLSRKLFEGKRWREPRVFSEAEAFIDLIQRAVWKPTTVTIKGQHIELGRGEFCYSLRYLADAWMWHKSKVQRWLDEQIADKTLVVTQVGQQVGQPSGQRPTVYRLVNYSSYQLTPAVIDTTTDTESGTNKNAVTKNTISKNKRTAPAARQADSSPEEPAAPRPKPWTAQAIDRAAAAGFYWPAGRIACALKPHVDRDGWPWVEQVWAAYLRSRQYLDFDRRLEAGRVRSEEVPVPDTRFMSPQDFATNYGFWDLRVTPQTDKPLKEKIRAAGRRGTGDVRRLDHVVVELPVTEAP